MAVGQNGSTNPFDEPSEEEDVSTTVKAATTSPAARGSVSLPAHPFPFIKILILLGCTTLVFILMISGTATTAIAYPPKRKPGNDSSTSDDEYRLLGPLLLTSGCFLLCVNVALCYVMIRDAYYFTKPMSKSTWNAWNNNSIRPLPISFVGGPFFIATADPAISNPPFLPMDFSRPGWVHPNAPSAEPQTPDDGFNKHSLIRPGTATLSRGHQPPYNPDAGVTMRGGA